MPAAASVSASAVSLQVTLFLLGGSPCLLSILSLNRGKGKVREERMQVKYTSAAPAVEELINGDQTGTRIWESMGKVKKVENI